MFRQWMCIGVLVLMNIPLWAQQDQYKNFEVEYKKMVSEQRVALVIGNQNYENRPLNNPVNDADSMAATLRACGFTVLKHANLDLDSLHTAVYEFGQMIKEGGVGLLYYSGHGIQVDGKNYLVPMNAKIEKEYQVKTRCLNVDEVLYAMEDAGNRVNILILDACRDNPYEGRYRSSGNSGGLATINAPSGTFIAYATAPGQVALDGTGSNNPFTELLVEMIHEPGLKIEEVFKKVRIKIEGQTPWDSSSLTGDFYFKFPQAKPNQLRENYQAGVDEYKRGAHSMALLQWRPLAEKGDARAENNLGYMYYKGEGVERNAEEAIKWFRRAAEQRYAKAQNNLGYMYYKGEGVERNVEKTIKWFRRAAEQGFVYAQYELGCDLYSDYYDVAENIEWCRKAAKQGYAEAQYNLGYFLAFYLSEDEENGEEVNWLSKAAEQGHSLAQYLSSINVEEIPRWLRQITAQEETEGVYDMDTMCALVRRNVPSLPFSGSGMSSEGDAAEARKAWFHRAAEQGYDTAQNTLGVMYYWGYGGWTRNIKEAVKWFLKAAKQEYVYAQYNLGFMYYYGKGLARDTNEAAKWFRKAAEQGHTNAQYYMGLMYYKGEGVLQDYVKAHMWLNLAAAQNYDRAIEKRNEIAQNMTANQIADAQNQVREWSNSPAHNGGSIRGVSATDMGIMDRYHRDAKQGNAMAQYNLGDIYYYGMGVDQDPKAAIQWYHKAANQGYVKAQYALGKIYYNIERDYRKAMKWYRKAAQGHAEAQHTLGQIYYSGIDDKYGEVVLEKNHTEAVKWYRRAAEQGHEEAQYDLGFMYQYGKGVEKDDEEAMKWYLSAAGQKHAYAQYNLGRMYAYKQNYFQAYMWLEIAQTYFWRIDKVHDYRFKAEEKCEEIAQNMTDVQIDEAQDKAQKWDWSHRD